MTIMKRVIYLIFSLVFLFRPSLSASNNNMLAEPLLKYKLKQSNQAIGNPPLIILLHGYGSNEDDLFELAEQLPSQFLVISARAPYTLSKGSYAWYHANFSNDPPIINKEEAEKSRLLIPLFIDQIIKAYNVDPAQIYLVGFSQGAIMSYSVALSNYGKLNGIAALSGRLPDNIDKLFKPSLIKNKLKVFIAHGTDDNIIRIIRGQEARDYLKTININAEYHEYPVAHSISPQTIIDLVKWLTK